MLAFSWAPIVAIGLLHYGTSPSHEWLHDVLRRLYYLPILAAAFSAGLRGSLCASLLVSLTYLPHAFTVFGHDAHMDPGGAWDKALEVVLYNVVAVIAGYLASAEKRKSAELRAALEEQQLLQKQLVRAGRLGALGELVAGVTHEIKTPLHALKGTAEIIDPLIPSDCPERRMWDLHVSEIERLGGIAERFQSFAKPAASAVVDVDLDEVARRVHDLLAPQAKKQRIAIEVDAAAGALVRGDRDQLAQVGLNIAVNAIRAIGDGGRVRLRVVPRARTQPSVMHALVIDNDGPPIADDEIEHLFDPFVGGHPDGTGLGLSIAERIVQLYDGYIEAANAGLGVSFTVFLPPA